MAAHRAKTPVQGILEQLRELGGLTAVALTDRGGHVVASAGDDGARAALSRAVCALLARFESDGAAGRALDELFQEREEYDVRARAPGGVHLLLRRVGEDWALAAIWGGDAPIARVRSFALEAATRLEAVS